MYPPGTEPQGSQNPSAACPLPHISPSFLLFSFFSLSLYFSLFTPPHHQNPPKPSREKGKSIAAVSRKKSRSERQLPVYQIGSANFQRYFFPLDGGGGVLIESNYVTIDSIHQSQSCSLTSDQGHSLLVIYTGRRNPQGCSWGSSLCTS